MSFSASSSNLPLGSTAARGVPNVRTLHPDQLTIVVVTRFGVTEEQATVAAESEDCEVLIGWDGPRAEQLLPAEPYRP